MQSIDELFKGRHFEREIIIFPGRSMRSLIAIERNGARQAALTLERPPEESLSGSDIPLGAQEEIDGLSIASNSKSSSPP